MGMWSMILRPFDSTSLSGVGLVQLRELRDVLAAFRGVHRVQALDLRLRVVLGEDDLLHRHAALELGVLAHVGIDPEDGERGTVLPRLFVIRLVALHTTRLVYALDDARSQALERLHVPRAVPRVRVARRAAD